MADFVGNRYRVETPPADWKVRDYELNFDVQNGIAFNSVTLYNMRGSVETLVVYGPDIDPLTVGVHHAGLRSLAKAMELSGHPWEIPPWKPLLRRRVEKHRAAVKARIEEFGKDMCL